MQVQEMNAQTYQLPKKEFALPPHADFPGDLKDRDGQYSQEEMIAPRQEYIVSVIKAELAHITFNQRCQLHKQLLKEAKINTWIGGMDVLFNWVLVSIGQGGNWENVWKNTMYRWITDINKYLSFDGNWKPVYLLTGSMIKDINEFSEFLSKNKETEEESEIIDDMQFIYVAYYVKNYIIQGGFIVVKNESDEQMLRNYLIGLSRLEYTDDLKEMLKLDISDDSLKWNLMEIIKNERRLWGMFFVE